MEITVNNTTLHIFEGAKVKDAIRMYYAQQDKSIPKPMPIVRDAFGHILGVEGSLLPNTILHIEGNV